MRSQKSPSFCCPRKHGDEVADQLAESEEAVATAKGALEDATEAADDVKAEIRVLKKEKQNPSVDEAKRLEAISDKLQTLQKEGLPAASRAVTAAREQLQAADAEKTACIVVIIAEHEEKDKACGILKNAHPLRKLCRAIHESAVFEPVMLTVILLSATVLAFETREATAANPALFHAADAIFFFMFFAEFLVKVIDMGLVQTPKSYLRKNGWNVLDFVVILIGVLEIGLLGLLADLTKKDVGGMVSDITWLRVLRVLRLLRALKLIKKVDGMRVIITVIISCLPMVLATISIVLIINLAFAIVGLYLFAGNFWHCSPTDGMVEDCIERFNASAWNGTALVSSNATADLLSPSSASVVQTAGWCERPEDASYPMYVLDRQPCEEIFGLDAWTNPPYGESPLPFNELRLRRCMLLRCKAIHRHCAGAH